MLTLRSAWDAQPLALLTRTAPAGATAGHLCVVGYITRAEMCAHTTKLEVAREPDMTLNLPSTRQLLCE